MKNGYETLPKTPTKEDLFKPTYDEIKNWCDLLAHYHQKKKFSYKFVATSLDYSDDQYRRHRQGKFRKVPMKLLKELKAIFNLSDDEWLHLIVVCVQHCERRRTDAQAEKAGPGGTDGKQERGEDLPESSLKLLLSVLKEHPEVFVAVSTLGVTIVYQTFYYLRDHPELAQKVWRNELSDSEWEQIKAHVDSSSDRKDIDLDKLKSLAKALLLVVGPMVWGIAFLGARGKEEGFDTSWLEDLSQQGKENLIKLWSTWIRQPEEEGDLAWLEQLSQQGKESLIKFWTVWVYQPKSESITDPAWLEQAGMQGKESIMAFVSTWIYHPEGEGGADPAWLQQTSMKGKESIMAFVSTWVYQPKGKNGAEPAKLEQLAMLVSKKLRWQRVEE